MLEAVFGCHAFDSSSRSGKFSYRCRPIPHLASVGPVAPIGVGGRKCTGNDGVKHASLRLPWRLGKHLQLQAEQADLEEEAVNDCVR